MNNTLNNTHIRVVNGVLYMVGGFANKYLKQNYSYCKISTDGNILGITFSDKNHEGYSRVRSYPNRSSYRINVGSTSALEGKSFKMVSNVGRSFKFSQA